MMSDKFLLDIIFDSDSDSDCDCSENECENESENASENESENASVNESENDINDYVPKIKRRFWVHPYYQNRDVAGAFNKIFGSIENIGDPKFYTAYIRMSSTQFEELFSMVGPLIKKTTFIRVPLCEKMRLVITLRYNK